MSRLPTANEEERLTAPGFGAAAFAALLVFISLGYFQNSRPGWNVNSQFALTCALVEHRTFSIDAYHQLPGMETGDKAFFDGRFYSDKSPVTAFLGVPAFAAYRQFCSFAGAELDYARARYWTTWWTIGLSAALLTLLTSALLRRFGVPERTAAALAGLWIMATPLLGFGIIFYNYLPAAALALSGFLLIHSALGWQRDAGVPAPWPSPTRFLAAGLLIGLACWTLQTYALLALILTLALIASAVRTPSGWETGTPGSRAAGLLAWAVGGILGVAGYAAYSFAIFGELTSPYRYEFDENFREQMARGLMGAGWPDLHVLRLITIHPFRGLFFLFPITAAATLGAFELLARRGQRLTAGVGLAFLAGLLVYNAGYFMWWGGWSYAPRHLIPALTLLVVGLAPWVAGPTGMLRRVTLILLIAIALAGAVTNTAVVSLDPQPPAGLTEQELYEPASVASWPAPFFDLLRHVADGQTDTNWGTALGLRGAASLVPLLALWIVGLSLLLIPRAVPWGTLAALLVILGAGGALRLAGIRELPPGLWFDEALNLQDAIAAALGGRFRLVYPEIFPREPMFITLLALAMKAGLAEVASLRLIPVAVGVATLLALHGCLRAAGERSLALLAPAVLAVLRWHALMSRLLFRTLLLPLWLILIVWAGFAMRRQPSAPRALALGALIGGGFYTYLAWYFLFPGVAAFGLWAIWPALRSRAHRATALLSLLTAALTAAPMAWHYATHPEHLLSRPQAVVPGGADGDRSAAFAEIRKNAVEALGMFHRRGDHVPIVNLPEAPALDPLMGAVFIVGLGVTLWGAVRRRPLEIVLLGWLVLGLTPTIFTHTDSPNFLRTLAVTPALAAIVALGLVRPGEWIAARFTHRSLCIAGVAVAIGFLAFSTVWTTRDIFFRWARDERVWRGFNAAEAQIGRAARSAPDDVSFWIPDYLRDHRTVRFLTSDLKTVHSYRDFAFLRAGGTAPGPRRIVVTLHNQLYPALVELVPEGRLIEIFEIPGVGRWGAVFEIPAEALPHAAAVDRAEARHPVDDIRW